jgi:DNA-binding response OmpR family regulator
LDAVPVIVFTASFAQHDSKMAVLLGASDFISKPASFEELAILLKRIFSRGRENETNKTAKRA